MKKLLIFLAFLIPTIVFGQATTVTAKTITASQTLYVRAARIDSISSDGTFTGNRNTVLPTQSAVKSYVANYVAPYVLILDSLYLGQIRDTIAVTHTAGAIWSIYPSGGGVTLNDKGWEVGDAYIRTNTDSSNKVILKASGVAAGSYTNSNLTVDSTGRITVITNGTSSSTTVVPTIQMHDPANIQTLTFTNNHVAEGTSISAGYLLGSPSTQNWVAQMCDSLGITSSTNRAVSGSAVMDVISRGFTNDPATNPSYSYSVEAWTNNYGEDTSAIKQNAIREGLRTLAANHFMDTVYAISNSVITKTGTWTNLTGVVSKSLLASLGNPMKSSTSGNTLTMTFLDNNIWIGTYGYKSGQNYGSFTVSIDGVLQTNTNTISPGYGTTTFSGKNLSDQFASGINSYDVRMPVVFGFTGFGTGSHTLIITLLQSVETDFDYIGKLMPPNRANSMLVMHMPYLQTPTGYNTYPIGGSSIGVDSINRSLDTIVNIFAKLGYPIAASHVNQYIVNSVYDADGIHPNANGHILLADAGLAVMKRGSSSSSSYPYILTVRNADSTNADSLAYSPLPDTMVLKGLIGAGGTNVTVGPKVLYIGSLSRQVITTGTTATGPTGTPGQANLLVTFNFASTASTFTYTMPASPIDQQTVEFEGGGTLTSGNEITTLTLSGNSGQTIIGTALTSFAVGASAKYRWNATLSAWLRILN